MGAEAISLFATTESLAGGLSPTLGRPVRLVPLVAHPFAAPARPKPRTETPVIAVPDQLRMAKRAISVAAIVARFANDHGRAEFAVHLDRGRLPAEMNARCTDLVRAGMLREQQEFLDPDAYERLFAECDRVLLPYDRARYANCASGVFVEAACMARPAIVPAGTSMAEHVLADRAAGIVFAESTPQAVAAAVAEALQRLPELSLRALAHAPRWVDENSADRVFSLMLGLS